MAGYWPSSFFACVCEHEHTKKEQDQYPAILIEQAWSIKDLLYGIRHQKSEFCTLIYFQWLKRKPVTCKNQWRILLYPNWMNAEIQSFDWFTFLTRKCLTCTSEWNDKCKKPLDANSKSF